MVKILGVEGVHSFHLFGYVYSCSAGQQKTQNIIPASNDAFFQRLFFVM